MLPVRAWRVDYADGTAWHSEQGSPPDRGVLAVVLWHDPPYRTWMYGTDNGNGKDYEVAGVWLAGAEIPDERWYAYLARLHAEPHALEVSK